LLIKVNNRKKPGIFIPHPIESSQQKIPAEAGTFLKLEVSLSVIGKGT
jgi:hypothetical protein